MRESTDFCLRYSVNIFLRRPLAMYSSCDKEHREQIVMYFVHYISTSKLFNFAFTKTVAQNLCALACKPNAERKRESSKLISDRNNIVFLFTLTGMCDISEENST